MNRFLNKKILLLVILLVGLFFSYRLFWYGRVNVTNLGDFSNVTVDSAGAVNESGVKLRPGTYTFRTYGPLVKPQNVDVSVAPFANKSIALPVETFGIEELVSSVVANSLNPGYQAGKAQLLENNTWLVVFIFSSDLQREGSVNIYNFNGFDWQLFQSGTGFELEGYTETGFPDSVIRYLSEEQ